MHTQWYVPTGGARERTGHDSLRGLSLATSRSKTGGGILPQARHASRGGLRHFAKALCERTVTTPAGNVHLNSDDVDQGGCSLHDHSGQKGAEAVGVSLDEDSAFINVAQPAAAITLNLSCASPHVLIACNRGVISYRGPCVFGT